ncbi:MAG: hypothetical protein HZB76_05410 [Chlamydiae bacterium]|nr:hypothetical protein [Chlamydiota bacterium]
MNKRYFLILSSLISSACLFAEGDDPEQKPAGSTTEVVVATPDAQPDPAPASDTTETK